MEVLVALAILTFSALALARLAATGRQHLVRSVRITQAQTLCQAKLDEIRSGVMLPGEDSVTDPTPFLHDPEWSYLAKITPTDWPHVVAVEVSVVPTGEGGEAQSTVQRPTFRLVEWVRSSQLPGAIVAPGNSPSDEDAKLPLSMGGTSR